MHRYEDIRRYEVGKFMYNFIKSTYLFTSLTCLFVRHMYTCILQDKGVISVHVPPDCKVQSIVLTASIRLGIVLIIILNVVLALVRK